MAKKSTKGKASAATNRIYDILTLVVLLVTLGLCGLFAMLFSNPYAAFNPFPPATPLPAPPTPTNTPLGMEPTWTATATIPPTATSTPRPTITLPPTNTPYIPTLPPTNTPAPTITIRPTGVPFTTTISTYESITFQPGTDCSWFGVAGQALDSKNNPLIGLIVRVGGSLPGKSIYPELTSLTGIAPVYGPSGFEFVLGVPPVDSKQSLWIQLYDQGGAALSDKVYLQTYNDCKKNLILVRFKKK